MPVVDLGTGTQYPVASASTREGLGWKVRAATLEIQRALKQSPNWEDNGQHTAVLGEYPLAGNGLLAFNRYSASFDGIDEYVDLTTDVLDYERDEPFTVSYWMKWTPASSVRLIFDKRQPAGTNTGIQVVMWNQRPTLTLQDSLGLAKRVRGTANIGGAAWHHVVFTYDGSNTIGGILLYTDGLAAGLATIVNQALNTTIRNAETARIGGSSAGPCYAGKLDELSTWTRDLTLPEVQEIYSGGKPANLGVHSAVANLAHWYRFTNEDLGDWPTIYDHGNGEDGAATNMDPSDIQDDVP